MSFQIISLSSETYKRRNTSGEALDIRAGKRSQERAIPGGLIKCSNRRQLEESRASLLVLHDFVSWTSPLSEQHVSLWMAKSMMYDSHVQHGQLP